MNVWITNIVTCYLMKFLTFRMKNIRDWPILNKKKFDTPAKSASKQKQ